MIPDDENDLGTVVDLPLIDQSATAIPPAFMQGTTSHEYIIRITSRGSGDWIVRVTSPTDEILVAPGDDLRGILRAAADDISEDVEGPAP